MITSALAPSSAYSVAIYDGVRDTDYDTGASRCSLGTVNFDPFFPNKDYNFVVNNPTCLGFITSLGAALVTSEIAERILCKPTNSIGLSSIALEEAEDSMAGPPLPQVNPATKKRAEISEKRCAKRTSELVELTANLASAQAAAAVPGAQAMEAAVAALTIEVGKAATDSSRCCAASNAYLAIFLAALAALTILWDQSMVAYENARICGHDWYKWTRDVAPPTQSELEVWALAPEHQKPTVVPYPTTGPWRKISGYKKCLDSIFLDGANVCGLGPIDNVPVNDRRMINQLYREFIYGGKEFPDYDGCSNPSTWSDDKRDKVLGYKNSPQRYYMTGPGATPVYACSRFISNYENELDRVATKTAYECCKRRSQSAICIESKGGLGGAALTDFSYKFCEMGSRCSVGGITYDIYASRKKINYVCAKTFSVCPYDHLLGGGTEVEEIVPDGKGTVNNFCQVTNHCSKIPILPTVRTSNFTGAWISSACYDMKGDTQNVYGYTAQLVPVNTKTFSAGMVQCYKETMENIFFNVSGRTECKNPNESADATGNCPSGNLYTKGQTLPGKSFFLKVQDNLRSIIKMFLCLSVVTFGISILLAAPNMGIDRKKLLMYVLKMGLVMFFAMGNGWQVIFFDKILSISQSIAEIVFTPAGLDYQVNVNGQYYSCTESSGEGLGGRRCTKAVASPESITAASKLDGCQFPRFNYAADPNSDDKYLDPKYPPGKEYLKIWDMFDCKLAYALGFGQSVAVPNLLMMILAGFLTGGLGVIFFVASFFLAFLLISVIIKAMHIFLISMTATILLLYVSPLTITCALFERTKGIYTGWLKQIIGFTLQLTVLFAYLGIVIVTFDKTMIGENVRFDGDGLENPKSIICVDSKGNAIESSVYCIFGLGKIENMDSGTPTAIGLGMLGITLPKVLDLNASKLRTVMLCAFIMSIVLHVMDQITSVAATLVGGSEIKSNWNPSALAMASQAKDVLSGIQTRGNRAIVKHGKSAVKAIRGDGDGAAREETRKEAPPTASGGDKSSSSKGGGDKTSGGSASDSSSKT